MSNESASGAGTARPDAAPSERSAIDPVEFIRARREAERARDPLAESSAEDILLARIAALRSKLAERDAECEGLRSANAEATKKIGKHAGDLWSAYRDGFLDSACRVNTDVLPMEELMTLVDERAGDYIARRREP